MSETEAKNILMENMKAEARTEAQSYINDVIDDDHVEDIYLYFKESETDDLDAALDELGNDYTEDEIRLVRIKFISEMAN